jgi:hypothetical protein
MLFMTAKLTPIVPGFAEPHIAYVAMAADLIRYRREIK